LAAAFAAENVQLNQLEVTFCQCTTFVKAGCRQTAKQLKEAATLDQHTLWSEQQQQFLWDNDATETNESAEAVN
jgi:hypothetical protein